ncbi:MAG: thioredoxin [Bacteroidetes bacterium]|nr:thioredoxin [Bacteroidota bacterium]
MAVQETTDSLLFLQVSQYDHVILKYDTDEGGELCEGFRPIYQHLSGLPEYKGVVFLTIDAENNPVAKRHILSKKQPVITIYHKGRLLNSTHTSTREGVEILLDKLLEHK